MNDSGCRRTRRFSMGRLPLAVVVALVAGLVASGSALAGEKAENSYELSDKTTFTLTGKRVSGACQVKLPVLELGVDEAGVERRMISQDPTTCKATFEMGTPPAEVIAKWRADTKTQTDAGRANASKRNLAGRDVVARTLAAHKLKTANYKVWYRDLIGQTLNSVHSVITFQWGHSCLNAVNRYSLYYWYSFSGWVRDWKSAYHQGGCNQRSRTSTAHYTNAQFCWPLSTTTVLYDDIRAIGKNNGTIAGAIMTGVFVNGACFSIFGYDALWS